MVLWRLANALLRVRHHAFKTPMDISRKQTTNRPPAPRWLEIEAWSRIGSRASMFMRIIWLFG
jgi:hypothetical protein